MTFCVRLPASITGMPAWAGVSIIGPDARATTKATLAAKSDFFTAFSLASIIEGLVRLRERHVLGDDDVEPIAGADFQGWSDVQIPGNHLRDGLAENLAKRLAHGVTGPLAIPR